MNLHSLIGLITNSSSEVYTWPSANYEETLLSAGQVLLDSLGIEASAADYFSVGRSFCSDSMDRFLDSPESYFDESSQFFDDNIALLSEYGLTDEGYYWQIEDKVRRAEFLERQMDLITKYAEEESIPLTSDGYNYFPRPNFDVFLVVKSTGKKIKFNELFDKVYEQDAAYDG